MALSLLRIGRCSSTDSLLPFFQPRGVCPTPRSWLDSLWHRRSRLRLRLQPWGGVHCLKFEEGSNTVILPGRNDAHG